MSVRGRHVPQRTCIVCRQVQGKRQLIRVVRSAQHGVVVDPTGKAAGRGAYLCQRLSCWERALRGPLLNRALRTTLSEGEIAALRDYVAQASPSWVPEPAVETVVP